MHARTKEMCGLMGQRCTASQPVLADTHSIYMCNPFCPAKTPHKACLVSEHMHKHLLLSSRILQMSVCLPNESSRIACVCCPQVLLVSESLMWPQGVFIVFQDKIKPGKNFTGNQLFDTGGAFYNVPGFMDNLKVRLSPCKIKNSLAQLLICLLI